MKAEKALIKIDIDCDSVDIVCPSCKAHAGLEIMVDVCPCCGTKWRICRDTINSYNSHVREDYQRI